MFGSDNTMQQPGDANPQVVAPQPEMMNQAAQPMMAPMTADAPMPAAMPTMGMAMQPDPMTMAAQQPMAQNDSADEQSTTDHLAGLKQEALDHLSPLVQHLDQSPEEKFHTTMMMIQASDNHRLLSEALDAAKQISEDKARAQALLDIINEINYFTQVTTK